VKHTLSFIYQNAIKLKDKGNWETFVIKREGQQHFENTYKKYFSSCK
jgi:hypothetical protein